MGTKNNVKITTSGAPIFDAQTCLKYLDETVHLDKLEVHQAIDSTNTRGKLIAVDNQTTLIVAEQQTAGRGRNGRAFHSTNSGIYFSLLFYPNLELAQIQYMTVIAAVAVIEAIAVESHGVIQPQIKWLNDIYVNMRKVCGILAEGKIDTGVYEHIVLGIGINLYEQDIPADLQAKMSSLEQESGLKLSAEALVARIINNFYRHYQRLMHGDFSFMETYRQYNFLIGKTVYLPDNQEPFDVVGINNAGHLQIVRNGVLEELQAGEVSLHGFKTN